MNTEKTLQELATRGEREKILEQLKNGRTLKSVLPYKPTEEIIAIITAALLPEDCALKAAAFDLQKRRFSDEAFDESLVFLNDPIDFDNDEFSEEEMESLSENGIKRHWQLLSWKNAAEIKVPDYYFDFPIETPVVFTEGQRKQLED